MIIEIHGADFRNKGSELMLRTTVSEIKKRLPDANFVMDPLFASYSDRSKFGLLQYFPPRGWIGSEKFKYLFPLQKIIGRVSGSSSFFKKILKTYGMVVLDEVEALIDVSGFAFSSQWGEKPCVDFATVTDYYSKRGKPIILLPQAFGPFEEQEIKKGMSKIINNSNLIYTRDRSSNKYLKDIKGYTSDKIEMAPDITFFHPKRKFDIVNPSFENECLIIPNTRMLDQGSKIWGDQYVRTLTDTIFYLKEKGLKTAILIHDTMGKDLKIAEQLRSNAKHNLKIYNIPDPIDIKKKIATAPFIVTSRYHGAIAAFSQMIPSICFGWSHKYDELYKSFGMSDFVISAGSNFDLVSKRLDQLLDNMINKELRRTISTFLNKEQKKNEAMWDTVIQKLTKKK